MVYPTNAQYVARAIALDPARHTGLLGGMENAEQAFQAADLCAGIGDRIDLNLLTVPGTAVGASVWAAVLLATELYCGHFVNTSDANLNALDIPIRLRSAGTYRLDLNAMRHANGAIIMLYVDGVQIGVPAGYDLYNAALDPVNVVAVAGLVLTAGAHTLRIQVNGRNGASGGWAARLSGVSLRRTA
jgi:hypothetical protein